MSETESSLDSLQILAEQLKMLADPTRLLVFDLLMHGVQCNCELSEQLQLAPNLISHHLRILSQAGLVSTERDVSDGRWIYYSVDKEALEELIAAFSEFFNPGRVKPRHPNCGPQVPHASYALEADLTAAES